jgi:hypothetical protein
MINIVVLMGPEESMNVLADQVYGINWDGTGVGYGVRGSHLENLTIRFGGKNFETASFCELLNVIIGLRTLHS